MKNTVVKIINLNPMKLEKVYDIFWTIMSSFNQKVVLFSLSKFGFHFQNDINLVNLGLQSILLIGIEWKRQFGSQSWIIQQWNFNTLFNRYIAKAIYTTSDRQALINFVHIYHCEDLLLVRVLMYRNDNLGIQYIVIKICHSFFIFLLGSMLSKYHKLPTHSHQVKDAKIKHHCFDEFVNKWWLRIHTTCKHFESL